MNLKDIDQSFNHIQLSLNVVSLYPSLEDEIIWMDEKFVVAFQACVHASRVTAG